MIVVDTNILSALMRAKPDAAIVAWLDDQPDESIWLTAISLFEIRFGLELLSEGKRRKHLESAFRDVIAEEIEGRVLPFDEAAAESTARLAAVRQREGRSLEYRDLQIAGIVKSRRATLATRNARHFRDLGLQLIEP